jgi:micrococcal nuclease
VTPFVAILSLCVIFFQAQGVPALVVRVVDGDTLIVRLDDGREERVRLAAIDAPEISRKNPDPRGLAAAEFVRRACQGQEVLLLPAGRRTVFPRDRYRRLVARVLVGGQDLGAALVFLGLATAWAGRAQNHSVKISYAQIS